MNLNDLILVRSIIFYLFCRDTEARAAAEEALRGVRAVVASGCEEHEISRYGDLLANARREGIIFCFSVDFLYYYSYFKLGAKQSMRVGLGLGFMNSGMFFACAFTFWIGGAYLLFQTHAPNTAPGSIPLYEAGSFLAAFFSILVGFGVGLGDGGQVWFEKC